MSALYLLDANVLIEANADYYPHNRIPQFWLWLASLAQQDIVKMPGEILDEIRPSESDEPFAGWFRQHRDALLLDESPAAEDLARVFSGGYGFGRFPGLQQLEGIQNGAQLVASALMNDSARRVVTRGRRQSAEGTLPRPRNRKIPLVCRQLDIPCIDTFELIRELDFRIPL